MPTNKNPKGITSWMHYRLCHYSTYVSASKLCDPSGRARDGRCFHCAGNSCDLQSFSRMIGGHEYSTWQPFLWWNPTTITCKTGFDVLLLLYTWLRGNLSRAGPFSGLALVIPSSILWKRSVQFSNVYPGRRQPNMLMCIHYFCVLGISNLHVCHHCVCVCWSINQGDHNICYSVLPNCNI